MRKIQCIKKASRNTDKIIQSMFYINNQLFTHQNLKIIASGIFFQRIIYQQYTNYLLISIKPFLIVYIEENLCANDQNQYLIKIYHQGD